MLNYPEKISYSQITKREKITRHKQRERPAEPPQKPIAETADLREKAEAIAKLSPYFKELSPEEQRQAVERIRKDLESQSENRE
ncbi:hypothetical protein KJ853_01325 [Patescibacteria group bacterium]|nr:hypothetical protein [Patescibacteria group bacterium]